MGGALVLVQGVATFNATPPKETETMTRYPTSIRAGDTILRVEDMVVVGSKAMDLKARAGRDVGQALHLQLRHADGQTFAVNMVAVPRP